MDCRRNAIHTIGIHAFDHRILHGMTLREVTDLLKTEKHIDIYNDIAPVFLYGTFAKKMLVQVEGKNPMTEESIVSTRTRIENRIFNWDDDANARTDMTVAKYWDDSKHPKSVCEWSKDLPVEHISNKNVN